MRGQSPSAAESESQVLSLRRSPCEGDLLLMGLSPATPRGHQPVASGPIITCRCDLSPVSFLRAVCACGDLAVVSRPRKQVLTLSTNPTAENTGTTALNTCCLWLSLRHRGCSATREARVLHGAGSSSPQTAVFSLRKYFSCPLGSWSCAFPGRDIRGTQPQHLQSWGPPGTVFQGPLFVSRSVGTEGLTPSSYHQGFLQERASEQRTHIRLMKQDLPL